MINVKFMNYKTPLLKVDSIFENIELYIKNEGCNLAGSIKDRAAKNVLSKLIECGKLKENGKVIESSSGNMGIALAFYCNAFGLKFYCVVDPNINRNNLKILQLLGAHIIMVDKADKYGGYLISRINEVRKFLVKNKDAYWINQYDNLMLIESYECIADEIIDEIKDVDYLFMAISSAGSISGVSRRIKKISPNTKVVCVDVNGSIIFGSEAKKRYIPGAGSSIRPSNLNYACIDEVIFVDEIDAINMCHSFTEKNYLIGGSSGLVLAGIKKYFDNYNVTNNCSVVTIFPDRGDSYIDTVYNNEWVIEKYNKVKR